MTDVPSQDDYLTRREAEIMHDAHEDKHHSENAAIKTALDVVSRERSIHAGAHEHEHLAHQREHGLNNLAIDKAEGATDKRFQASNAYREQMNSLVNGLTSKDAFDGHTRDMDRRYEDLRAAVVELQKVDVRGEGRARGQGMVIAAIAVSVSVASGVLGIVIVIANVVTARP